MTRGDRNWRVVVLILLLVLVLVRQGRRENETWHYNGLSGPVIARRH